MSSSEAYAVERSVGGREDTGNFEHVEVVGFEGMGKVFWRETAVKPHPPVIEVVANTRALAETDMPFNDQSWPIVSVRMLEALLRTGPFPHEAVPVRFRPRRAKDREVIGAYVVLRHTTHLDVFDRDRSQFEASEINPKRAIRIRRLVLRRPAEGFPSSFRIPDATSYLFVSGEAKRALEAIPVQGVEFVPVEVS